MTTTTGGENANLTFAGIAGNRISIRISGVTMSPKPNTGIKVSILKPDGSTLVSPFDVGAGGHLDGAGDDARHRDLQAHPRRPEHL